ncbi:uncharacterized protein [Apostichopus japonicus]|uniref:uncharacterized protein isoform X3 n=1 Tax=Stichopus japonicus TaxID=307972 RepID=UPI003AB7AB27
MYQANSDSSCMQKLCMLTKMATVCHVCGADGGHFKLRCRPHSTEPFFPFLEQQSSSRGTLVQEDGHISACRVCHAFLNQQWLTFEKSKTPISKRLYWLKRFEPNGKRLSNFVDHSGEDNEEVGSEYSYDSLPVVNKSRSFSHVENGYPGEELTQHGSQYSGMDFDVKIPNIVVCYCCAERIDGNACCIVHTSHWSKSEAPYFPCILTHPTPEGAKPVDQLGRVLMCEPCTLFLVRQWQTFEGESVPIHERRYHLRPTVIPQLHSSEREVTTQRACVLCFEVPKNIDFRIIHSKARTPGEPFYPFLTSVATFQGKQAFRKDGTAQVCGRCAKTLDEQWNAHELAGTPLERRVYQITKCGQSPEDASVVKYQGTETSRNTDSKHEVCYLCGSLSPLVGIQWVHCGEKDNIGCSTEMSFPFIRQWPKPHNAKTITDDHVHVCCDCHKQLQTQWETFEERGLPLHEQEYTIKGRHPVKLGGVLVKTEQIEEVSSSSYVCHLCGHHNRCGEVCTIRALPVDDPSNSTHPFFPFLLDIKHADGATPLQDDKTAFVCVKCEANLLSQWEMYEKSSVLGKTKPHLRSYLTHSFICTTCRREVHIQEAEAVSLNQFPSANLIFQEGNSIKLRRSGHIIICSSCKETFERCPAGQRESNDKGDPNSKAKSDSVIVIDSDSDGEKDNNTSLRHHNHHYSSPTSESNLIPESHRGLLTSGSPEVPVQRITPEARSNSQDEISPQVSPGSSSRSPSSTPSNKNFHLGPSPLLAPTSTPPVVTITPTHSVNSRLTSADSRRELERYPVWRSKDSPTLQPRSRPMPHIPKPEDNRGFQPYRPGEDMRLPNDIRHSHLTYDPAVMAAATMASYPIPPAFIPPTHLPYHAFRADEQMERYGYLRQPFFPLTPPHLIPHPSLGLIPGLRYPSELMHMPHLPQGVSYGGLVSNASSAERERVLQDLRERERKIEEAREAEMQLHRERSNSLSERDERLKVSDIRRSPPREPSHISRIHPHSSRSSSSSSSYDHAAVPMALIKKTESEDKWAHKTHQSHTSPHRSESRHDDSHRTTQGHKDKQYQRNSLHESSRTEPEKSHIPSLFPPDRRHEREPTSQKEHSKARPPPLIANHVPHEYSNHRTAEPLHSSSGLISHKAHSSAMSSDEGQSFSVKKAKMNARIPSPLNLQLQHPPKEKLSNHKTMPVLKPLDMEKPQKKFEFHYKEFQRIQSLRADAQNRNQNLLEELDKDSIPVIVSKLDLEAKKRKEVRASGIYISSESESDSDEEMEAKRDRYRRKMLRITTRSKMPLDKTEDKVAFLGAIGLVSQQTKEEIVNERRKKRRSLLKEESPSRIRKACKPETPPPSLLPPPANISTKQFKKEPDYSKKCEFLHNCHLKLSSTDKKRELESARQYVEAYRTQKRRRLVEKTSETSNEEVKEPTNDSEESLPPGTPLAVQCGAPTIPVHVPAQLYKSSSASQPQQQQQQPHQQQQLSASHKAPAYTLNNHHLLQTVPPLQNGMVHSTSKALSSAGEIPRDQMGGAESLQKGADVKKKKKSSQFSIASFLDLSHSGKHVDAQSFAQEFHNSVLRKTQKSLANQKSGSAESNRRETFFGDQQQHSSSHSMLRHHPYSPAKPISASHSSFQWPGVDQISEAYYRHKTDQELEKMILKDQLGRLQSNNIELRSKDEKLTQRMSDLAESQQLQSKTQESVQKEIQQLQKCFEDVKKTISNLSKSS